MTYLINSEKLILGVFLLSTALSLVLSQDEEIVNCHDHAKSVVKKYGKEAKNFHWFPRCLKGGYYENVQCNFYDCFCAYLDTGHQIPNTLSNLLTSYMKENCPRLTKKSLNMCTKPPVHYPCKATSKRFYLNSATNKCEPSETSCLGFETEKDCSTTCVIKTISRCDFPMHKGKPCKRRTPRERWYYDGKKGGCRQFLHEGCGGNLNNYGEKWKCSKYCERSRVTELLILLHDTVYIVSLPTWLVLKQNMVQSVRNKLSKENFREVTLNIEDIARLIVEGENKEEIDQEEKEKYRPNHAPKNMTRKEICSMYSDVGPCKTYLPRWYFSKEQSRCVMFIYGGCLGNENRHDSAEGCAIFCDAVIKLPATHVQQMLSLSGKGKEKQETESGPTEDSVKGRSTTLPTTTQAPEENTTVTSPGVLGENEVFIDYFD